MDLAARRYALALTQEAESTGQAAAVDADVVFLGETLDNSRELVLLFRSPVVSREKKENVLKALFAGRVSPLTMRFLHLLVSKQREDLIPAVVEAVRQLRDLNSDTVEATVRAARPLSEADTARLKTSLEARSGQTVRLKVAVDPALIGGLVVRLGDVVYDRSVRHQLETLRGQLAQSVGVTTN
ncbi:MAG TPA: ATP synthase F1 subunit delta [Rubricoccaceae bacterium]